MISMGKSENKVDDLGVPTWVGNLHLPYPVMVCHVINWRFVLFVILRAWEFGYRNSFF